MEAIQKIGDEPLKDCPECEQETLRKLVSAAAFKLTGTGWYETDFKHNDNKAEKDKKPAKDSDKKPDTAKKAKGKGSDNSGKNSEVKAEKPKKKRPETESSK